MADISRFLQDILDAIYGEQVRGSIHDAIELINDVSEVILTTGTAITAPTDSSEGYYTDSLYLNTDTYVLWKCVGTNAWQSLGILKGATGNGIDNIAKTATAGLVDTYTITYTDGTTDTFDITNGEDGDNGNRWYRGTAISGKAVLPTVYPTGIADANANDFYLNPSEGAIYHCVTGGNDQTATWSYDFTMTGGGGGGSIVTWTQTLLSGTKIAEIDIDGSTQDVYAPTGGSGTSSWGNITGTLSDQTDLQNALDAKADSTDVPDSLDDLSDVSIDTQTLADGQILAYNQTDGEFQNVDMPQGGHTMIPNNTAIASLTSKATDNTDDDVASGYAIANWSNTDTITLLTPVNQGDDTVGTWEDDATWESGSRAYWLKHTALHGILSDDDVEISLVFDVADGEAISCLAYRIDDAISSSLGGIAIKFNAPVQNAGGATVGVVLKRNRTNTETVPRTS